MLKMFKLFEKPLQFTIIYIFFKILQFPRKIPKFLS